MKKIIFAIVSFAMIGFASISCTSHRSVRVDSTTISVGTSGTSDNQGTFKRCTACDGKGACVTCKGTGRISGDACRTCKGTGKCPSCGGDGGYYVSN
jgi:hypothetical protein